MMDFSLITDEPLNYCVYAHVNKQNGKMYIGITCRIEHRWSAHGYYYKLSTKFWRAIQKYGWDNFEHIVLINGISESMTRIYEKELITKYDTQNNGYNILPGGEFNGSVGKKVYQYDLDGNYIQEWDNCLMASRVIGINHQGLCECARSDSSYRSCGGFMWRYYSADHIAPYQVRDQKPIVKPIVQYDLNGNFIKRYEDINHSQDIQDSKRHHIINCCNMIKASAYGYLWFWEDEVNEKMIKEAAIRYNKHGHEFKGFYKKVCKYSLDGELLHIYESVSEVSSEDSKFYEDNIRGACTRPEKRHYYNGYLWYYYEQSFGKKVPPFDGVRNKQKLFQYSLNGEFIKEYESIAQANSEFKGLKSRLSKGENMYQNYLWFRDFKGAFIDMEVN